MQLQPTIKAGDHVSIPKGTEYRLLRDKWASEQSTDATGKTTRDAVVKVIYVNAIYHDTEKVMEDYQVHCGHGDSYRLETRQQSVRKITGYYVFWADGKYTLESNVTKAEAPVRKERAEPTKREPTLRQRLVKGTKWKMIADVDYFKPQEEQVTHPRGHTYTERTLKQVASIPAGAEFNINDKGHAGYPYIYRGDNCDGVWYHVTFSAGEYEGEPTAGKKAWLRLSDLNGKIEQVGETEAIPIFVIQDKVTKEYYAGYNYQGQGEHGNWTYALESSPKLTKAKKFNRLADVRTHALVQSGYYYDLPAAWGDVPDWMCGSKSFDIPDTWEIVKIDKLTKDEMERIELIDTFKRSWRLRELTVKYGSAVRQVYSDLEKKGKLGEYSAMMYFSVKDNDKYRYDYELTEDEKAGVQEMIDRFDKTELKAHKTKTGFAVAVKDDGTAAMARLMYTGKLDCGVVNFTTMQEVVVQVA